jgi:hypothetical protein
MGCGQAKPRQAKPSQAKPSEAPPATNPKPAPQWALGENKMAQAKQIDALTFKSLIDTLEATYIDFVSDSEQEMVAFIANYDRDDEPKALTGRFSSLYN